MASIKKSELRLLVIFGILIFGAVTFFVLEIINGRKNDAITQQRAYENKIREYQDLIGQKEQWEVKREFVQRYQPVYRTEEQEAPALEAYFRSAAQSEAIEIKTLRPMPPEPLGDTMMAISLEAKVSGAGPDVLRFLIQLQAETRFYAIPSVAIVADRKDPSLVTADLIFSRWFTLDGEQPVIDEEVVPAAPAPAVTPANGTTAGGTTAQPPRPVPAGNTNETRSAPQGKAGGSVAAPAARPGPGGPMPRPRPKGPAAGPGSDPSAQPARATAPAEEIDTETASEPVPAPESESESESETE